MSASQADVCEPLSLSIYDSQYERLIHRGSSKAVRKKKNLHRQSPAATLPFATGLGLGWRVVGTLQMTLVWFWT